MSHTFVSPSNLLSPCVTASSYFTLRTCFYLAFIPYFYRCPISFPPLLRPHNSSFLSLLSPFHLVTFPCFAETFSTLVLLLYLSCFSSPLLPLFPPISCLLRYFVPVFPFCHCFSRTLPFTPCYSIFPVSLGLFDSFFCSPSICFPLSFISYFFHLHALSDSSRFSFYFQRCSFTTVPLVFPSLLFCSFCRCFPFFAFSSLFYRPLPHSPFFHVFFHISFLFAIFFHGIISFSPPSPFCPVRYSLYRNSRALLFYFTKLC